MAYVIKLNCKNRVIKIVKLDGLHSQKINVYFMNPSNKIKF